MQNAKCKMQNAKCKMQNAKCKMQKKASCGLCILHFASCILLTLWLSPERVLIYPV